MFELHPRLAADTVWIGDLPLCRVLLAKDGNYPWLILVPRREGLKEIHHLPISDQHQLMDESSAVAALMESALEPDKINVAALGNLVPQLHIHHVARFKNDPAWSGPIWGANPAKPREEAALLKAVTFWRERLASVPGFTGKKIGRRGAPTKKNIVRYHGVIL